MGYWGVHSYDGDGPMDLVSYLDTDPAGTLLEWVSGKPGMAKGYSPFEILGAAMYKSFIGEWVDGRPQKRGITLPPEVYIYCGRVLTTLVNNEPWLKRWREPADVRQALSEELDHVLAHLKQLRPDVRSNEWRVRWRLHPFSEAVMW